MKFPGSGTQTSALESKTDSIARMLNDFFVSTAFMTKCTGRPRKPTSERASDYRKSVPPYYGAGRLRSGTRNLEAPPRLQSDRLLWCILLRFELKPYGNHHAARNRFAFLKCRREERPPDGLEGSLVER